jgi:hypothetical protein
MTGLRCKKLVERFRAERHGNDNGLHSLLRIDRASGEWSHRQNQVVGDGGRREGSERLVKVPAREASRSQHWLLRASSHFPSSRKEIS